MNKSLGILLCGSALVLIVIMAWLALRPESGVSAEVNVFASPVHGGCYIAGPSECRVHMEPFTINIASGKKLVKFTLVAVNAATSVQTVIYDWRPDLSNPVPTSGTTYTPSLVALDFAASCGASYKVALQGQDSGDTAVFNLGLTGQFTCPASMP